MLWEKCGYGKRMVFEDHSAQKKKQEEYEKWQAENSRDSTTCAKTR